MNKNNLHKANKDASYEVLSKQYSDEELAESFVFPSSLNEEERKEAHAEFIKIRQAQLNAMSDEELMYGALLRMKYLISDYLDQEDYNERYSFAHQLQEYIKTTRRNQKELSNELGIDKTKLSKLLKEKINPSIELCFRLEKHSDEILSAKLWYRLYLKQLEQELVEKDGIRKAEYEQVKGSVSVGLTG